VASGRLFCSDGSQANAMIAQTCSGINVAGASGRTVIRQPHRYRRIGRASQQARQRRTSFFDCHETLDLSMRRGPCTQSWKGAMIGRNLIF
jgi:hypothetical protein